MKYYVYTYPSKKKKESWLNLNFNDRNLQINL